VSSPLSILDYHRPVDFRIGDVISKTFTILSRRFLTFFVLVGIVQLVPTVMRMIVEPMSRGRGAASADDWPANLLQNLAVGLVQFIMSSFASAVVVHATFQDLRGKPVSAMESFGHGVSRIIAVAVSSVLVGLLTGIGFLLCLIPGLIALTAMAVTMPACVVEELGPIASMSRSNDLTGGNRWPILGVAVVGGVIALLVGMVIGFALPGADSLVQQLAMWLWGTVAGCFTSVYTAILYHDLRAVREGIGIDEIASVFD
jgi:hypothetical protein